MLRHNCRECESLYYRSESYRERANEKNALYRAQGLRKEQDARHYASRAERHPEAVRAVSSVRRALDSGRISRPFGCEECGDSPPPMKDGRSAIQAHHDDYSRPLDVRWLCHGCHIRIHRARAQEPRS